MKAHDQDAAGSSSDAPASPQRRGLLLGLAAGSLGLMPSAAPAAVTTPAAVSSLVIPFHGPHQAGITTPQPYAGLVAAFDVLAENREELRQLFITLTTRAEFLMHGGTPPELDEALPPADSGVLGPTIKPEHLTMTVAVGASLFDGRFGLAPLKPKQLAEMEDFPNDALDAELCHGDLMIQFCAETPEEVIHALRDIVKATPDLLAIKWKQEGFAATHGARSGPIGTGRNLLGFKDGTANADIRDDAMMNAYVWVQPDAGEPAWSVGGSYQVVRLVRNFVERWDRTPLSEQEAIFGRARNSGAPLGKADEFDEPGYPADPNGEKIPLTSHIRLANPRTPEATARLIRRGFNYSNGVSKSGQLDMGLLFVSFQSDLAQGFIATQNRLNGEPLEEYIKPFGGGYYFVLPGVAAPGGHLGQGLFADAASLPTPSQQAPAKAPSNKG
ncbi:iron uptake transporter deferrochelatase/peroxidase subunit [Rhodopseudomonas palustris]|uniref:Deferrochelatase n=1 Tax=Rhodopseudomonas palustris (strain BisB18) TaxID=316056 RepID=Q217C3_RHOPB